MQRWEPDWGRSCIPYQLQHVVLLLRDGHASLIIIIKKASGTAKSQVQTDFYRYTSDVHIS
jgi:hypothetical protein